MNQKNDSWLFPRNHTVAIYTVLSILIRMKQKLGLEAMLQFAEKYLLTVDQANPQVKSAVNKALNLMSIEKIFTEAISNEKV